MDAFDRAARTGVVFGVALALVAAALVRSHPAPSLISSGVPAEVIAVLDRQSESLVALDLIHDEEGFIAWTSKPGIQTCVTLVIATEHPVRDSAADQLLHGRTCGPPDVKPTDRLYVIRTLADPGSRFGVAVVLLPDDHRTTEWDVSANPEPTQVVRGPRSFALVYRGDIWDSVMDAVQIEVSCGCGDFTTEVVFS